MFKKVIGQDNSESQRSAPPLPDTRRAETTPAPAYGSGQVSPPARPAPSANRNILSSDVEIKGTVKFSNDLVVDGKIDGEITSDGNLTVGENARIKAEIKTASIIVYGKVQGNLTATDRIELKSSAEVVGDIKAKTLAIDAGAIFVGKSTVGTPVSTVQPTAAPAPTTQPTKSAPEAPKQGTLSGTIS